MDLFINKLDPDKFRETNNIWNILGLNSPQNVGMVSELITQKSFSSKEEWEEFYYEQGRSKAYLADVGMNLYNGVKSTVDISLDECIECVRFRVICETWNGIIMREPNTIKTIDIATDNKFEFRKTSGNDDFDYAIDFEMFDNNKLLCGLQIKPSSYDSSDADYLVRARKNNEEKNRKYEQKFNVPVFTITASSSGAITSGKQFAKLISLVNN